MTLEALMRLRQEIGGADEIAQAHRDSGLIVEQAGCGQYRTSLHESTTAFLQFRQCPLQRALITHVIADPGDGCRELLHHLWWDVVRERGLGRVKRCQGLLQRK